MQVLSPLRRTYRELSGQNSWAARRWLLAYSLTLLMPLLLIVNRLSSDIALSTVGLLFLYDQHRMRNTEWRADPVMRIAFFGWCWLLYVSLFAIDIRGAFGVAFPWIRFVLFYAALRHWVAKPEGVLATLTYALCGLLGFVMIDTSWQYVFGISLTRHPINESGRLTGPLDNVKVGIYMAKMLLPAAGIALYASLQAGRKCSAIASIGFLLAGLVVVLLTGERTAFFSIMAGIGTILVLLIIAEKRLRPIALGVLALIVGTVILMLLTQPWVQERAWYLYKNLSEFGASTYGQLFLAADYVGMRHWLTGAGPKGFRILCISYQEAGLIEYCDLHPHNPYLEWFSEAGAAGLAIFVALVGALATTAIRAFMRARETARLLPAVALGTVVVHFFPLMATQSQFSNWPAMLLWYSLSLAFAGLGFAGKARD